MRLFIPKWLGLYTKQNFLEFAKKLEFAWLPVPLIDSLDWEHRTAESWEGNKCDLPNSSTLRTPALIGAVHNRYRQERSAWILIKHILAELLEKDLLIEGQIEF